MIYTHGPSAPTRASAIAPLVCVNAFTAMMALPANAQFALKTVTTVASASPSVCWLIRLAASMMNLGTLPRRWAASVITVIADRHANWRSVPQDLTHSTVTEAKLEEIALDEVCATMIAESAAALKDSTAKSANISRRK